MAYVTVEDVKAVFSLEQSFTSDDAAIELALDAAIEAVASYTGRTFADVTEESARIFPGGAESVLIDDAATVTEVEQSADHATWATATGWWTMPDNASPITTVSAGVPFLPWVRVTGTWGYGTVPASVKQATILAAVKLFKRRETPNGIAYGGEFGPVRISRYEDPDVVRLLDGLRRADRVLGFA